MKDLSKEVIKSIEDRHVRPIPHWQYVAKKVLSWGGTILLMLLGALSFALAIYLVESIDWDMYSVLGYGSISSFFMNAFPYALIIFLAIFLVLAYRLYRQTPKGHKRNLSVIAALLFFGGVGLSTFLHVWGVNSSAYFQLAHVPMYHQLVFTKEKQWSQPEKGLLWGEVLSANSDELSLRDAGGKNWNVYFDSGIALEDNLVDLSGSDVKIMGKMKSENEFQAQRIQRWDGVMKCNGHRNMMGRRGMMRGGGMMGGRGMMNK